MKTYWIDECIVTPEGKLQRENAATRGLVPRVDGREHERPVKAGLFCGSIVDQIL